MAITLFGDSSNPVDNGTGTTSPVVITPPGSMQAGDLVFVTVCYSGTSGTLSVSETGGQTWTALTTRNQTRNRTRSFWCVFNGTWSASPSWTGSGSSNVIAKMVVFRPDGGTASTWVQDVPESSATYAAPSSPYTVTNTGITTQYVNAVAIAGWTSADDNTWTSLSGTEWALAGGAQVRNTSGTYQQSAAHAYRVMSSPGATGDVSYNQYANAPDAGTRIIMAFHEVKSPTPVPDHLAVTGSQLSTTEYGSAVKVPAIIEMAGGQYAPQVNTGDTVSPAHIAGMFSPLAPAIQGPRTAEPNVIAAQSSQVDPTIIAGAVAVESVISAVGAQYAPTLSGSGVVAPSVIAGTASQPAPSISGGNFPDATTTPNPITGQFSVSNNPATEVDAIHVAAEVTGQGSVVTPGYVGQTTGAVTVACSPVDAAFDQPTPSFFAQAVAVIQSAITAVFQTLAPVLAGTLLYVAEPILATADEPPPTIHAGAVVTPDPIAATADQVNPVMAGTVIITPTPIAGRFTNANVPALEVESRAVVGEVNATASLVDSAVILGGDVLVPILETTDATASVVAPSITLVTVYTPDPITGTFSAVANDFKISTIVSPNHITGAFSQVAASPGSSKTIEQGGPLWSQVTPIAPTLSISSAPILIPDALTGTVSQPEWLWVGASAVVPADPIDATIELLAPSTGGEVTVHPAILTATASVLAPVEKADGLVSPAPVDALASAVGPTIATEVETIVAVGKIDATASLLTPAETAEALAAPNVISSAASQKDPTIIGAGIVAVGKHIDATADQPGPSVSTAGNITVRPAIITGNLTLASSAGIEVDADVVPAELGATLTLPDPLVWNTPVTVAVEPITGSFALETPAAGTTINWTVSPNAIDGHLTLASTPSPSVSPLVVVAEVTAQGAVQVTGFGAGAQVTPTPITGTFGTSAPIINAAVQSVTTSPLPISGRFSPSFANDTSADAELVPVEVEGTFSQPTPSVVLAHAPTIAAGPLTGMLTLPTPIVLVGGGIQLTPDAIGGTFSTLAPTFVVEKVVAALPIDATASTPAPNVAIGETASVAVAVSPITGTFSTLAPTPSATQSVTVAPEPCDGTASLPAPSTSFPWAIEPQNINGQFSTVAPTLLINSANIVPAPIYATSSLPFPKVNVMRPRGRKQILANVFGSTRIFDTARQDAMVDAPDRERIIDIYISRGSNKSVGTEEFELEMIAEAEHSRLLGRL